jgi:hypothetical protein
MTLTELQTLINSAYQAAGRTELPLPVVVRLSESEDAPFNITAVSAVRTDIDNPYILITIKQGGGEGGGKICQAIQESAAKRENPVD